MTICTHCNKVCESKDVCYQCGNDNGLSDVQEIPSCSYCKSLTRITTASDCCGEETKEVDFLPSQYPIQERYNLKGVN